MMIHQGQLEAPKASDPLDSEPSDQYGIPLTVEHSAQTDLPVWQFIHKLATPIPNPKSADRLFTHICILCSASPPMRPTSKRIITWRNALMRQRMSTNAVAHMQRVHPEEFGTIAEFKQRKREALEDKVIKKENHFQVKKTKITPSSKRKLASNHQTDVKPLDPIPLATGAKPQLPGALARERKTVDLIKMWLIPSGLPFSVLHDEALQQLLAASTSTPSVLPTVLHLNAQIYEEATKFRAFLDSYLAFEFQAAMKLPFLSVRHEYRSIDGIGADHSVKKEAAAKIGKAFLGVEVAFIDSKWRKVDLVLTANQVQNNWNQQLTGLAIEIVSKKYNMPSLSHYARFHVRAMKDSPSNVAREEEIKRFADDKDVLTHNLRNCVMNALEVGATSNLLGKESDVRRILRLLQEVSSFCEEPERATAEICATKGLLNLAPSIDTLALSSLTSIGAIAELLRVSCSRYRAYKQFFQSPNVPTENPWTQLSMEDWHTVTEIEALLHHLVQFRLEERTASRPGAVASSYVLLFRRLLSVTINASSFKCFCLQDESGANLSPGKHSVRRKAKRVDSFTATGRQCIERLEQLITQQFTASDSFEVDDEIKAMLLDPRISAKAITLVKDPQVFHRAQEALRQEHRAVFQLLAAPQGGAHGRAEDEDEDEEDDEISSLLMVDGPKNRLAPPSTANTGRRSSEIVVESEARAWQEWQQVHVAWDTIADKGADLFDKGQYNLLKLYHHVNILKWFRDIGQQAHPAAALLARIYLGKHQLPSPSLESSVLRFMRQEEVSWVTAVPERAETRCILYHNWRQIQQIHAEAEPSLPSEHVYTGSV